MMYTMCMYNYALFFFSRLIEFKTRLIFALILVLDKHGNSYGSGMSQSQPRPRCTVLTRLHRLTSHT
jgi:hypothetical protein